MRTLLRFLKDHSGATAIEYGLIAAGIAVVIVVSVQALGTSLTGTFQSIESGLSGASSSSGSTTTDGAGG